MKSGIALKWGKLNSNHYLLHFRHLGTPEKQRFGITLGSPKSMQKSGLKTNAPKSHQQRPKSDKHEVPKGAKRVPWEPQNAGCGIKSTAQALLGLKSAAQALAARGGGRRLPDDSSTTRRRLVHDSSTRISSVPTPSRTLPGNRRRAE